MNKEAFFYGQINITNIIILLVLIFKSFISGLKNTKMKRFFLLSISFSVALNIFDLFFNIGKNNILHFSFGLMSIINAFYFLCFTLAAFFWFAYSEVGFKNILFKNIKESIISAIPIFILVILLIANEFTGCLFTLVRNEDGTISQKLGPLFYLQQIISFFYIILSSIKYIFLAFSSLYRHEKHDLITFFSFAIPPILFAILQIFFPYLPILSSTPVASYILVYTSSLQLQLSLDPLTGINNKRRLIVEIKDRIKSLSDDKKLFFLFMDVNSFKAINDEFGHYEGDRALQTIANVLQRVALEEKGFCARYGGDEFAYIQVLPFTEDINFISKKIEKLLKSKVEAEQYEYELTLSIGITEYVRNKDTAESLIIDADRKMYEKKIEKQTQQKSDEYLLSIIKEGESFKNLFNDFFDGVMLINVENGNFVEIDKKLTKKFLYYLDDKNKSHDFYANKIIDENVIDTRKDELKRNVCFETVKEKLKYKKKYSLDFEIESNADKELLYKRINYEYFDKRRKYIVMFVEDITTLYTNDIDPLTGIYDSTGFHKRVREWINFNPNKKYRIQRYNLDHFKDINGLYGYDAGDKLLHDIGEYMHQWDTKDSFCGHLNADHFVRFSSVDSTSVEECYNRFITKFSNYGLSIPITIHIGVYDLCEDGNDSFRMSYKALLALQNIKYNIEKPIAYYKEGMLENEQNQLELLRDVDRAIKDNEFELYYQPQIDFFKKQIVSAEALIRWNHHSKGFLTPSIFIPLLEKSNYISNVDLYVIDKVCSYLSNLIKETNNKKLRISVNLSRKDIINKSFLSILDKTISKYHLSKQNLHLEITESAYMEDVDKVTEIVNDLRKHGYIIEMDDFGSAYSSLNTLKDISIDKLKLDMKFLMYNSNNNKGEIIIQHIIKMAKDLNLDIIAEGVETKEQVEILYNAGCSEMQGYYFSKPISPNEFEELILGYKELDKLK